jgi:hypothetical protein
VEQPTSRARGLELSWTPELDPAIAEVVDGAAGRELRWSFEVEVEVAQESPDLEPQRAARTITVVEARAPSGS